jgi:hypothetical protein
MITPEPVFSTRWRPLTFICMQLLAALLLLSFASDTGHEIWRGIDREVFYTLNGSLFQNETWAAFWAWMNTRELDALTAVVMLLFLVFPGLGGLKRNQLQTGFTGFLLLILLMLPMRELLSNYAKATGLTPNSP